MNLQQFLNDQKVNFEVLPHTDTYDAQRMAQALHVPGRDVAKTVLLRADGGYAYYVAVLPATKRIDFERASAALGGSKLELAPEADIAKHCPDCEVGALPPFGSQYGMRTLMDQSLMEEEQVVFEGNTHHEAIRMRVEDYCQVEEPVVTTFCV